MKRSIPTGAGVAAIAALAITPIVAANAVESDTPPAESAPAATAEPGAANLAPTTDPATGSPDNTVVVPPTGQPDAVDVEVPFRPAPNTGDTPGGVENGTEPGTDGVNTPDGAVVPVPDAGGEDPSKPVPGTEVGGADGAAGDGTGEADGGAAGDATPAEPKVDGTDSPNPGGSTNPADPGTGDDAGTADPTTPGEGGTGTPNVPEAGDTSAVPGAGENTSDNGADSTVTDDEGEVAFVDQGVVRLVVKGDLKNGIRGEVIDFYGENTKTGHRFAAFADNKGGFNVTEVNRKIAEYIDSVTALFAPKDVKVLSVTSDRGAVDYKDGVITVTGITPSVDGFELTITVADADGNVSTPTIEVKNPTAEKPADDVKPGENGGADNNKPGDDTKPGEGGTAPSVNDDKAQSDKADKGQSDGAVTPPKDDKKGADVTDQGAKSDKGQSDKKDDKAQSADKAQSDKGKGGKLAKTGATAGVLGAMSALVASIGGAGLFLRRKN